MFDKLPHSNPLSQHYDDGYTWLAATKDFINQLKSAGLTPEESKQLISQTEAELKLISPLLVKAFDTPRLSLKQVPVIGEVLVELVAIASRASSRRRPGPTEMSDGLTLRDDSERQILENSTRASAADLSSSNPSMGPGLCRDDAQGAQFQLQFQSITDLITTTLEVALAESEESNQTNHRLEK
jgi:hypothetical protein